MYLHPVVPPGNCFPPANETLEQGPLCYFWHVPAGQAGIVLSLSLPPSLCLSPSPSFLLSVAHCKLQIRGNTSSLLI